MGGVQALRLMDLPGSNPFDPVFICCQQVSCNSFVIELQRLSLI